MAKDITIDEQIKELERELRTRRNVYPEWTKGPNPRLKLETATHRIACIEATLKVLRAQQNKGGEQLSLL